MDWSDSHFIQHGSYLRKLLRVLLRFIYFFDHLTSDTNNLIRDLPKVEFQIHKLKTANLVLVYATYGEFDHNLDEIFKLRSPSLIVENLSKNREEKEIVWIPRVNRGFDLGVYRDSLRQLKRASFAGSVIFLNSSVSWDFDQLNGLINDLEEENRIVFMTSSYQGEFHYQTFFIFVPNIYLADFYRIIEKQWRNWKYKRSAVIFGEIELSKLLILENIPCYSFYDFSSAYDHDTLSQKNPSLDLVPELVKNPIFVKKSLWK